MLRSFVFVLGLASAVAAVAQYSVSDVSVVHEADTYRLSFNEGKKWSESYKEATQIQLAVGSFDPLVSVLGAGGASKVDAEGRRPVLIQFRTMALTQYRKVLEATYGVTFTWAMPHQSYVMLAKDSVLGRVRQEPYVRWVGEYQPTYKIQPELLGAVAGNQTIRVNVMVLQQKMQASLGMEVTRMGGRVMYSSPRGYRMEVEVTQLSQVKALAQQPQVLYIDLWGELGEDMDIAREIGGANYLESAGGYTGLGVPAEVCDSGLRTTHQDFRPLNLIIHGSNGGSTSHGTSVFGIVFGNGVVNRKGLGLDVNPSRAIFSAYGSLGDRYKHTEELVDPTGPYRAVFQTNSWGSAQTESYTSISAEMDDIMYQTDFMILQSQSNTGNRRSRPQAWAKCMLSVGGVKHKDTLTRADDDWTRGASIGPAQDGRIKPDLWHFYDHIYTTSSSSDTAYTPSFGGTSGATPITAGYAGLVFEMWSDGVFHGQPGQRRDVFDSRPHASTVKALMINSAFQYSFTGTSHDYSRYHQGWGMANIGELYDLAKDHGWGLPALVDENNPIAQSEIHQYTVTIPHATNPSYFKASLVYRDPAGSPSASIQLINNLNLRVTDPDGNLYLGNVGLTEGTESVTGGTSSKVDNVENVFRAQAKEGSWIVEVVGAEIVQDTYPATEKADAVYSLVVTYGAPAPKKA